MRGEQEKSRARERESKHLQIAALASALDLAKRLMSGEKGVGAEQAAGPSPEAGSCDYDAM